MAVTQRYLLYLSYIGTRFRGSQIQITPSVNDTVQGALEAAFKVILNSKHDRPVKVILSSRTDAGVHAIKGACHVDLPSKRRKFPHPLWLVDSLNKYFLSTKTEISVVEALQVPDTFHARKSAVEKLYIYRFAINKDNKTLSKLQRPITEINRTYFSRIKNFDIDKAKEATELFLGTKDFGALTSVRGQNTKSTLCNINLFTIEKVFPLMSNIDYLSDQFNYYQVSCRGNRFLYQMVRRMVSILLSVGSFKTSLDEVNLLFKVPHFTSWPPQTSVLPGSGLYLKEVFYLQEHLILTEEEKQGKLNLLRVEKETLL